VEGNGLVLNPGKSQLLISRGDTAGVFVNVGGCKVAPSSTLGLLGVTFDRTLAVSPHSEEVATSAKQRAGVVARLAHYVPRGRYLRQLAQGLFVGKLGHALPAVVAPRLQGEDGKGSAPYRAVQVSMNNVCRTLTGTRAKDRGQVADVLEDARFKSVNEMVVKATATEAWKAYVSKDGGAGERNPVGQLIFGPRFGIPENVRPTRSVAAGILPIDLRGQDTFVAHAAELWNQAPLLRVAQTLGKAKQAAKLLAKAACLCEESHLVGSRVRCQLCQERRGRRKHVINSDNYVGTDKKMSFIKRRSIYYKFT
jgi:hypothetical protein